MRSTFLIASAVILTGSAVFMRPVPDDGFSRAVAEVERLNDLRESLAQKFESAPAATQERFAEVCQPVGLEAQKLATATGWQVRQLAVKYRNPVNRADREAEHFQHVLASDTTVKGMWIRTEMNGQPGTRYFRSIVVREACMPCHGTRDSRPAFIKENYPLDRAYNFDEGDLRGVFSVFVPDPR
jgi:hypothetical protein